MSHPPQVRLSTDGLFSPLRDSNSPNSSRDSSLHQLSFKKPTSSFSTPVASPLAPISEEALSPARPRAYRPLERPGQEDKLSLDTLDQFAKRASGGARSPELLERSQSETSLAAARSSLKLSLPAKSLVCGGEEPQPSPPSRVKPSMNRSSSGVQGDFHNVLQVLLELLVCYPL